MAQQNLDRNSSVDSKYQKSEAFLWFHVALLSAVPLIMILGMVGLGVGDPVFAEWFEISAIGLPPIVLPIILQWWKPLSPFSLWLYAKPLDLTNDNERKILAVVKNFKTSVVAIAIGFFTDAIFCQMYADAPLVADILPLPDGLRILGIVWALGFFLISNLLLQMGAVAIRVLLLSEASLDKFTPLSLENINSAFTSVGWQSPKLLDFTSDKNISENLSSKKLSQPKAKTEVQALQTPPTLKSSEPTSQVLIKTEDATAEVTSKANPQVESTEISEELPKVSSESTSTTPVSTDNPVTESAWDNP